MIFFGGFCFDRGNQVEGVHGSSLFSTFLHSAFKLESCSCGEGLRKRKNDGGGGFRNFFETSMRAPFLSVSRVSNASEFGEKGKH